MSHPEQIDTTAALERQLALDLLPCDSASWAIVSLGLNPASPEGAEIEHIMSHARMEKVAPLTGPIMVYAAMISDIWTRLFIKGLPEGTISEEGQVHMFQTQMARTAEAASAVLANMFDAGFIAYGEAFNGV